MKKLLLISFLFPLLVSAQWKEDGTTQVWKAVVYRKDSVTGRLKDSVQGYVKTWRSWYWRDGKIDSSKGPDWNNIKWVMDQNHKKIPWHEYDHYSVIEPGSNKKHER